jgi:glutamate 5-kinase
MNNISSVVNESKKIVIKIGSSLIVRESQDNLQYCFDKEWFSTLANDIKQLTDTGKQVIIVSSGAIATAKIEHSFEASYSIIQKQALSSIGQFRLMSKYDEIFKTYGISVGQILVNKDDAKYKNRRQNINNTINTLIHDFKAIPIINENDAVNFNEIKIGDNDTLSAIIADIAGADLLIILSDIDGLYTKNPKTNPDAEFVYKVAKLTKEIEKMASPPTSNLGTGGMVTKLKAVQIVNKIKLANKAKCRVVLKSGIEKYPLSNSQRFTLFE